MPQFLVPTSLGFSVAPGIASYTGVLKNVSVAGSDKSMFYFKIAAVPNKTDKLFLIGNDLIGRAYSMRNKVA